MCSIEDILSDEIFPLLSVSSLVKCAAVCKQWKNIAMRDSLWKLMYIQRWGDSKLIETAPDYRQSFEQRMQWRLQLPSILSRWCSGANVLEKTECSKEMVALGPWLLKDLRQMKMSMGTGDMEEEQQRMMNEAVCHAIWLAKDAEMQQLWKSLLQNPSNTTLEQGACIIAKIENTDVDYVSISLMLDALTKRVAARTTADCPLVSRLQAVNSVLFQEEGLQGNDQDYSDPRNSFINEVLNRKLGIPVSLSLIYMAVCHRLDIPLEGVNTPLHFLIRTKSNNLHQNGNNNNNDNDDDANDNADDNGDDNGEDTEDHSNRLYIDAFSKGKIMREEDVREFLTGLGVNYGRGSIPACTVPAIFARMLRNLCLIYSEKAQYNRASLPVVREKFMLCVSQLVTVGRYSPERDTGDLYHLAQEVKHFRICGKSRLLQA